MGEYHLQLVALLFFATQPPPLGRVILDASSKPDGETRGSGIAKLRAKRCRLSRLRRKDSVFFGCSARHLAPAEDARYSDSNLSNRT